MRGLVPVCLAAAASLLAAMPASGQQFVSDSYTFIKAVRDRDGTKVQEMLDKPASTIAQSRDRTTGETGLHIVAKRRDDVYLQVLLARGAPVDGRDGTGRTALSIAAQLGWIEGAQLLLDRGASVDLPDNQGVTPLIYATQARSLEMVRLLLGRGADPRKQDSLAGMSAIDYATRDGRSPQVLQLLQTAKPVTRKRVSGPSIGG